MPPVSTSCDRGAVPLELELLAVARHARLLVHDGLAAARPGGSRASTCRRSGSRRRRPCRRCGAAPRRRPRGRRGLAGAARPRWLAASSSSSLMPRTSTVASGDRRHGVTREPGLLRGVQELAQSRAALPRAPGRSHGSAFAPRRRRTRRSASPTPPPRGGTGCRPCRSVPIMQAGMIRAFSSTAHIATPVRAAPISSVVWRVPSTKMPSRLPVRSTGARLHDRLAVGVAAVDRERARVRDDARAARARATARSSPCSGSTRGAGHAEHDRVVAGDVVRRDHGGARRGMRSGRTRAGASSARTTTG